MFQVDSKRRINLFTSLKEREKSMEEIDVDAVAEVLLVVGYQ